MNPLVNTIKCSYKDVNLKQTFNFDYRSTPVDCLHTILLGGYKYLFKELMERLSSEQKNEVSANIDCFPRSGLNISISGSMTRYHQSCVGRDFKSLAQIAPFVLWRYLSVNEKKIWLYLSKVFVQIYNGLLSTRTKMYLYLYYVCNNLHFG